MCTYDKEQRKYTQRHETNAQLDDAVKIIISRNNHAQFTIYQFKTVINKENLLKIRWISHQKHVKTAHNRYIMHHRVRYFFANPWDKLQTWWMGGGKQL